MKRNKKYTHITARVYGTAKDVSICQLRKYCNCTLSEAYWRLNDGKGLMSLYDQESFSLWSELMNEVAVIKSSIPLQKFEYEWLFSARYRVWHNMESYRVWLENGSSPIYISDIASSNGLESFFIYRALEQLYDFKTGFPNDDEMIQEVIDRAFTFSDSFNRHCQEQIDKGEEPDEIRIPYNKVYQIRADFGHKTSDSQNIRYLLDGIWKVSDKTSEEHRKIYDHNSKVVQRYKQYLDKPKGHVNLDFFLDILNSIKIPEFDDASK